MGLALALLLAKRTHDTDVCVFDRRATSHDVGADARTLAVSLGSVQLFERLNAWDAARAQPIHTVHVSQQPPSAAWPPSIAGVPTRDASVTLRSDTLGYPMLGAVLSYGALVAPLQKAWFDAAAAAPQRLQSRFGTPVSSVQAHAEGGVDVQWDGSPARVGGVDAQVLTDRDAPAAAPSSMRFDLAVIAEGGVFAHQARKAITRDYAQTAWVGTVYLDVATATPGLAVERFTRHGPAALLPLPPSSDGRPRAALVWCVPSNDDPVRALDDAQRVAVLNTIFPPQAGRIAALAAPLKAFALGLNAVRTMVDPGSAIVRIGNAAQTLHPVAGQGLNLGLRDAHALAEALRRPVSVAAALRRVEWQRAPDRWTLMAGTDFLARSFTWGWPGLGAARGAALAALDRAGPLKRLLATQMMFGSR